MSFTYNRTPPAADRDFRRVFRPTTRSSGLLRLQQWPTAAQTGPLARRLLIEKTSEGITSSTADDSGVTVSSVLIEKANADLRRIPVCSGCNADASPYAAAAIPDYVFDEYSDPRRIPVCSGCNAVLASGSLLARRRCSANLAEVVSHWDQGRSIYQHRQGCYFGEVRAHHATTSCESSRHARVAFSGPSP